MCTLLGALAKLRKATATAPFLCWVGLVTSRLLSKPVGLSLG